VLDEWFEDVVKPRLRGEAHEVRFADDAILCFHYREDAEVDEQQKTLNAKLRGLPVLRPPDKLSEPSEVLWGRCKDLAEGAKSSPAGKPDDVGAI
jgi:hypothetical protein